jgi:hypothetical protein
MQNRLLVYIVILAIFGGCSSSTQPTEGKLLGAAIKPSVTSAAALDGGGRWFEGKDTGTWYDLSLLLDLQNSTEAVHPINYTLELGYYQNGHFKPGSGALFFDGDSMIRNAVPFQVAGSSHNTLTIAGTVGIGRHNRDWTIAYGYRLTLRDITSGDTAVMADSLRGSYASNRFRGVIYTTEASPDSLGVIDGPDDGDWGRAGGIQFLSPCYPNPAYGVHAITTIRFAVPGSSDSVTVSLNRTRHSVLRTYLNSEQMEPGFYEYGVNDSLRGGMYRFVFQLIDSGKVYVSRGDILLTN